MMPLVAKLALEWLRAEHNARILKGEEHSAFIPPAEDDDEDPEIVIAADRVYAVMAGEVPWSSCGPGDRAIWKGRLRDVERFEQLWRTDPGPRRMVEERIEQEDDAQRRAQANYPGPGGRMPQQGEPDPPDQRRPRGQGQRRLQMDGIHQRYWMNWYDTIRCHRTMDVSTHLFGEKNLGNAFLTNLTSARRLCGDQTAIITSYYVSVSSLDGLRWAADNVLVQWVMGEKPQGGPLFVRDLFMGIVPLRPIIVPARQSLYPVVSVRNLGELHVERYLEARERGSIRSHQDHVAPFDLTVHCEGLVSRDTP